ncbi:MAG TPA: hypothetical protein VKF63_03850 [Terracidiphilus sp.]|nr:hypothetical protein [Terracidiphilus sp.]
MNCSKCGEPMRMTEKDTSSGRDIREYACDSCGHTDWEVRGPALWQILSDDREEAKAEQALADARGVQLETAEPRRKQTNNL